MPKQNGAIRMERCILAQAECLFMMPRKSSRTQYPTFQSPQPDPELIFTSRVRLMCEPNDASNSNPSSLLMSAPGGHYLTIRIDRFAETPQAYPSIRTNDPGSLEYRLPGRSPC